MAPKNKRPRCAKNQDQKVTLTKEDQTQNIKQKSYINNHLLSQ
jgi:hypothetical protein